MDQTVRGLTVPGILEALVRDLGGDPVHLVGHDLGAVIGWHFMQQYPQTLLTLTMVGTPRLDQYVANLPKLEALGLLNYRRVLERHDPRAKLPDGAILTEREEQMGLAERLARHRAAANPDAVTSLYRDMNARAVPAREQGAGIPVLQLLGREDPYFPHHLFADTGAPNVDNVETRFLGAAGHWPMLTHTKACAEVIQNVLGVP